MPVYQFEQLPLELCYEIEEFRHGQWIRDCTRVWEKKRQEHEALTGFSNVLDEIILKWLNRKKRPDYK